MTTPNNAHQPLIDALQAIVQHYANPNLSHQDYRVKACQQAEHALAEYRGTKQVSAQASEPATSRPYLSTHDLDSADFDTLRQLLESHRSGRLPQVIHFSTETSATPLFAPLRTGRSHYAAMMSAMSHPSVGREYHLDQVPPQTARLAELTQELVDAGLAGQRLRHLCRQIETDRDQLLAAIRDALRLLETIMASLRGTLSLQALDAIEAFLNLHAMIIVRIHLTASASSRSETN